MKRLALICAVLLSGVLVLTAAGLPTAAARPADLPSAPVPDVAVSVDRVVRLSDWSACRDPYLASYGLECARLTVPLDYEHPRRGTVSLAVTRREHRPAAGLYQGVLLTSPGGPGASGTWMPILADYVPRGAGDTYDWIGFDPRGVGASRPALRCSDKHAGTERPGYAPQDRQDVRTLRQRARQYARACGASDAARLLPHLGTDVTVRDMESLRQALQEERPAAGAELNFYGYSHGSYLGQVYATHYPHRVGRFVLDGVVDPRTVGHRAALDRASAFQDSLELWFRYLARYNGAFGLGSDWTDVQAGYRQTLRTLAANPAAGGRLGPAELTDALSRVGHSAHAWLSVGRAYADLVLHGNGSPLLAAYRQLNPADDNGYAVSTAVRCTDTRWPSWARQRADTRREHQRSPFLSWSSTWRNAPCSAWPVPAGPRVRVRDTGVTSQILLVNETLDAVTPYSGALRVRQIFSTARLVAGQGGTTHASSLSGVTCVDNAVAAYLEDGTTPTRRSVRGADLTCDAVEPHPPADEDDHPAHGLPTELRERLLQAQRLTR